MNDRLDASTRLAHLLDEQIATASLLLKTLAEEKRLLTGRDMAALNELDARKREQLSQTEHLEQQRRELCRRIGIAPEQGAMDYLINDLAATGHENLQRTLRTHWQRLRELVGQCRDANEVNGQIAQFKQRQLQHLLGILRNGGSGGMTYDPNGATTTQPSGSRALGQV